MTTPAKLLKKFGLKRAYERECRRIPGFQQVMERFVTAMADLQPAQAHVAPRVALYYALRDAADATCPQQALDAAVSVLVQELDIASPDAGPVVDRHRRLRQSLLAPRDKAA